MWLDARSFSTSDDHGTVSYRARSNSWPNPGDERQNQAGGIRNNDSAALAAFIPSSLSAAISSITACV